MGLINILKIIAAAITIGTGLLSLLKPSATYEFTGLRAEGGRGITEIRSILGALFIALGAAALYYRLPETYGMLGIMYLFIALVRLISMFYERSVVSSNIISLVTEIVLGVVLVLPS
ncbi:MAG: DUF4345 family protein [Anaerolineales bacterium]